jgi:hypothetical protein
MKIDPNRLTPVDSKPPADAETKTQSNPPILNEDTLDRIGVMQQYYQDLFQASSAGEESSGQSLLADADQAGDHRMYGMSTGGGGTPPASGESDKSDSGKSGSVKGGKYTDTIIDLNEDRQVAIGGDKTMPKEVTDLGVYKGGKNIAEGDLFVSKHQRVIEGEGDWGKAFFKAQSNIVGVQGRLFYEGKFSSKDFTVKGGLGAEVKVELIGAYYNLGYETPSLDLAGHKLNLNASADITASVQARGFGIAEVSVGKETYVRVGGEAFAGVRTTMEGSLGVGEFANVHGGMEAYAGVGAKGYVTAGLEDGEIKFDFEGGLAAGLGFGVDFGFEVNLVELGETAMDLGKEGLDAAGEFADWVGGVAGDVWEGASAGAQSAADAAGGAADGAGDVVDAVVDAAEDTAEAVADFVSDAVDW